jgi:hypothetical protein
MGAARAYDHQLGQQYCPMPNMADAKPMHKGGLACSPSRRRESKSEDQSLWLRPLRLGIPQCPAGFSGPRVVRERKKRLPAGESFGAKKSVGNGHERHIGGSPAIVVDAADVQRGFSDLRGAKPA